MNKEITQRQNFESAVKEIERLSSQVPSNCQFKRFDEKGGFLGLTNHKVTGKELNDYSIDIKKTFINQYESLKELYKVAKKIWVALDSLDEGYLKGIYASIQIGNEAIKRIETTQGDIQQAFTILKGTIDKLAQFKSNVTCEIERINKILDVLGEIKNFDKVQKLLLSYGNIEDFISKISNTQEEQDGRIICLKQELIVIVQTLAAQKEYAESLDAQLASNVESIKQNISDLNKSMTDNLASNVASIGQDIAMLQKSVETKMADDKAVLELAISSLQESTDSKVKELSNTEKIHKTEIDVALVAQKEYAESLNTRLVSNVEDIKQNISDLDKSMAENLASNVASIRQNIAMLQNTVETKMADDKAALELAISDLHKETEKKAKELESADIQNKAIILQTIDSLKEETTQANELNSKKFKWAISVAGISLILNIIFVTLYAFGII